MDLVTLDDVRTLLGHLPKEARQKQTWQHALSLSLKTTKSGSDLAV
jgi:hypothetical protein